MNAVNARAFLGLAALIAIMAALIFISAATLNYWQAWLFLAVYFTCSLAITLYLMNKDPALLQRRMRGGPTAERKTTQKIIMALASLGFIGFLGVLRVFKENTYTSSTVELAADQRVIATGPYAFVRHPMYAAALIMLVGIPIALGSSVGLIIFSALGGVVIWRLLDEEKFLAANLSGYREYQQKVQCRLIPGVW